MYEDVDPSVHHAHGVPAIHCVSRPSQSPTTAERLPPVDVGHRRPDRVLKTTKTRVKTHRAERIQQCLCRLIVLWRSYFKAMEAAVEAAVREWPESWKNAVAARDYTACRMAEELAGLEALRALAGVHKTLPVVEESLRRRAKMRGCSTARWEKWRDEPMPKKDKEDVA